jgi:hypothetical protein
MYLLCVHTATLHPVDSGSVQCIYYVYTQLPYIQWIRVVYNVFIMCTHSYLTSSGFRWCTMYLLCVHTATFTPVDLGDVQCIYYVYSVATLHPVDSGSVQCIYYVYSVATLHPVDSGSVQCSYLTSSEFG